MARILMAYAVAAACLCAGAHAQVISVVQSDATSLPADATKVVRLDIEKAIRRALTPPSPRAPPPFQPVAPPLPPPPPPPMPQAAPPAQESREQWRQRLFDEMRNYCTRWPDDNACGPNALSGGR